MLLLLLLLLNCNQLKINQLKCSEKQFIIEKQPKHTGVEHKGNEWAAQERESAAGVAQVELAAIPTDQRCTCKCGVLNVDSRRDGQAVSAEYGLHQVALLAHTHTHTLRQRASVRERGKE